MWDEIRGRGIPKRVRKGTWLYRKGDAAANLYFLVRGEAHVLSTSAAGRELIVRRLAAGDVFGEIPIFDKGTRTAGVRAITDCEVIVVDAREVRDFVRKNSDFALALLRLFAERLRLTTQHLEESLFLKMPQRLARTFLNLAQEIGAETHDGVLLTEPLSQSLLGRIVYATREDVNRELKAWERKGWLRKREALYEILDVDALEELAEGTN